MKKLFSITACLTLGTALFLTSCDKDKDDDTGNYTCDCTGTILGNQSVQLLTVSKAAAKLGCEQAEKTWKQADPSVTCELKKK